MEMHKSTVLKPTSHLLNLPLFLRRYLKLRLYGEFMAKLTKQSSDETVAESSENPVMGSTISIFKQTAFATAVAGKSKTLAASIAKFPHNLT
jgi:hypothetical protein